MIYYLKCGRSIIEIINWYFDYVFRCEVLVYEGLAGILFLILVHVVYFADPCLLDDLCTRKARKVGRVEPATLSLADSYLYQRRFLSM